MGIFNFVDNLYRKYVEQTNESDVHECARCGKVYGRSIANKKAQEALKEHHDYKCFKEGLCNSCLHDAIKEEKVRRGE